MILITASLFAHIQNDAHLSGTFGLEGNYFSNTVGYLKQYLKHLKNTEKSFPKKFRPILNELNDLSKFEKKYNKFSPGTAKLRLVELSQGIADKVLKLSSKQKLFLPGGWKNQKGGHALIYRFKRIGDEIYFSVINSGDGIQYHARKSSKEKELYNPIKTWCFSATSTDSKRLARFIFHLIEPNLTGSVRKSRPCNAKILYKEILPTISYLDGIEVNPEDVPDFAYTAGQLSGTCAQRSIHQMLKIHASSLEEYQRFTLEFKIFALGDFIKACTEGRQELTPPILHQIHLAIENNLKILNTPQLFKKKEYEKHFKDLLLKKEEVNKLVVKSVNPVLDLKEEVPSLSLRNRSTNQSFRKDSFLGPDYSFPKLQCLDGINFLAKIKKNIDEVAKIGDPSIQYFYLEKIILQLPIESLSQIIYRDLKTDRDFEEFALQLDRLQSLIHKIKHNLFNDLETPTINCLSLSLIKLQMDAHLEVTKKKGLPSFYKLSAPTMAAIVQTNSRNPFWATNNPELDRRFKFLQNNFKQVFASHADHVNYYLELLASEPVIHDALKAQYNNSFKNNSSKLHENIRKNNLGPLYLLFGHIKSNIILDPSYKPLVDKIKNHLSYESKLRAAFNPFFEIKFRPDLLPDLGDIHDEFRITSPFYPIFAPFQDLTSSILKSKYSAIQSPITDVLKKDAPIKTLYKKHLGHLTANAIQLKPIEKDNESAVKRITQADIENRDYFHIRSIPSLQIAMTLDYFNQHIEKLSQESFQLMVEANFFQPGLLTEAFKSKSFFDQLNDFLKTGFCFYNKEGCITKESLFFIRLDFLISRYLYETDKAAGRARLLNLEDVLLKQLPNTQDPKLAYVQHQYLFYTLVAQMEMGKVNESFALAYNSYFYLQNHANPFILEDVTHQESLLLAMTKFKALAAEQNEVMIKKAVEATLANYQRTSDLKLISLVFPAAILEKEDKKLRLNVLQAKIYERNLAQSGVPYSIQNHPLIKRLGLDSIEECLMSPDERTMVLLPETKSEIRLFNENGHLTIQKKWCINEKANYFELKPLTTRHQAFYANERLCVINSSLPDVLIDDSMDYWQSLDNAEEGLLIKDNVPIYHYKEGKFTALDEQGKTFPYQLSQLPPKLCSIVNQFESNAFILFNEAVDKSKSVIKLPRFDLNFDVLEEGLLVYPPTGEFVEEKNSPLHPTVLGLTLTKDCHSRHIVPVSRFYLTHEGAESGDYFRVIHDKTGRISTNSLEKNWKTKDKLNTNLWRHEKSATYVSFRLENNEPVADTVADALYLAYIYLATNQTEKAWKVLEDCNARLGGLTGDLNELKYIAWICQDVPHILEDEKEKLHRKTPPYVACQLKAMSLLADFFLQDRRIELSSPNASNLSKETINYDYAQLEQENLQTFLKSFPRVISQSFTRLQTMRRHLEQSYALSTTERKRLLDYYYQDKKEKKKNQESSSKKTDTSDKSIQADPSIKELKNLPKGALGFEWMSLKLELLHKERQGLLARRDSPFFTSADEKRLMDIESHLKKTKAVVGKSTLIKLVNVNLDLPKTSQINKSLLKPKTRTFLESWENKLPLIENVTAEEIKQAMSSLADANENHFIANFPTYFQLMNFKKDNPHTHTLLNFCRQTLIAARRRPLKKQNSNLGLLALILYRLYYCKKSFTSGTTLSQLIEKLSVVSAIPPITFYERVKDNQEILVTSEELIAAEPNPSCSLLTKKPENASLLIRDLILKNITDKEIFNQLLLKYQVLEERANEKLTALEENFPNNLEERANIEEQAGKILFELEQEKKKLANYLIDNSEIPNITDQILEIALLTKIDLQNQASLAWSDALAFANQGPEVISKYRSFELEKHAKVRADLKQSDLLDLYCHADIVYTVQKTGVSPSKAQELHDKIHFALVQSIQGQSADKLIIHLQDSIQNKDSYSAYQALELLGRKEIPSLDDPAAVIMQYEEKILLKKRQVSAIESLIDPSAESSKQDREIVEKIIPGGGKSKVLAPILLQKKARGDNLVVFESPASLLNTNHVDLNRTSQRLFGKRGHRFEFNRYSNCSPERLKHLYQHFIEVMTTRSYLVTTGESIQSLELKYLELLLTKGEKDKSWEKQVYWLDKITDLFHNHTDCIIDEAHQGLNTKKKLNYTLGETTSLNPSYSKNEIALFKLIDMDLITQAPKFSWDYDWSPFKLALAQKLVYAPGSPISGIVSKIIRTHGIQAREQLVAYLTNQETELEKVIAGLIPDNETLSFFKQQIDVVLSETLKRNLKEQYGPSQIKYLNPIEYTLAIPFNGNNAPCEESRFGHEMEAMNYTIQMMLREGLSLALFIEKIAQIQSVARLELFQNSSLKNLDETPTARGFFLLEKDNLSQIDIKNTIQMEALYKRYQFNKSLIFSILQEQSLKLITRDEAILPSDSFNHVDIYRSVQCLTGTPSNYTTYHPRLAYNPFPSLGSDDYIVEYLEYKKTPLSFQDFDSIANFLKITLDNSKSLENTRAIIDINATFTGISNVEVAQQIVDYINLHEGAFNKPIKHVLYFNESQKLCALDVTNPHQPIELGTSDEKAIALILGSKPDERFTYYDQAHTLGTDIMQGLNANALVFVDEKISFSSYIQGIMRMRGISQHQTVELIAPTRLAGITHLDFKTQFKKNERNELLIDNFFAASGEMKNYLRRHLLNKIQALPSREAALKSELAEHFQYFIIDKLSSSLFDLYGAITKKEGASVILERASKCFYDKFLECVNHAHIELTEKEIQTIKNDLAAIIKAALPFCLDQYDDCGENMQSKEVQIQKQVQKKIQLELEKLSVAYDPNLKEASELSWDFRGEFNRILEARTLPLNKLCSKEGEGFFYDRLLVSKNYATTYQGQTDYLNAYLKPVFFIWYHLVDGYLTPTIITPKEAEDLAVQINSYPASWITTTQDTLIAGKRPAYMLSDIQYQAFREQVRYFNGEFDSLLNQETPLYWISEDSEEKFTFFENKLQKFRPGSEKGLLPFKSALLQGSTEGFNYIATHPFVDHRDFKWKTLFRKTITSQANENDKLARAFVEMNQAWAHRELTLETFQMEFDLPDNALPFLDSHLKHISLIKNLVLRMPNMAVSFLINMSSDEQLFIEKCLGDSLTHFYEQEHMQPNEVLVLNEEEVAKRELLTIKILSSMRNYPAFENDSIIMDTLSQIANQASSLDTLEFLLNLPNPSQTLILSILKNPLCNDKIDTFFLESKDLLSEEILLLLTQRCHSMEQIELLIQRDNLTESIVKQLLKNKDGSFFQTLSSNKLFKLITLCPKEIIPHLNLSEIIEKVDEEQLKLILDYTHDMELTEEVILLLVKKCKSIDMIEEMIRRNTLGDEGLKIILLYEGLAETDLLNILKTLKTPQLLSIVLAHPAAKERVKKAIYQHPILTEEQIFTIYDQGLSDDNLALILSKSQVINKVILLNFLKKGVSPNIFLLIFSHPLMQEMSPFDELLPFIQDKFSLPLINIVSNYKLTDDEFLSSIIELVLADFKKVPSREHEVILIKLLEKLHPASKMPEKIMTALEKQDKVSHLLGNYLLQRFGLSELKCIPIKECIIHANSDQLTTILTRYKDVVFEKEVLEHLIDKSTISHYSILLNRGDIVGDLLYDLSRKVDLQPHHLIEILKQATTPMQVRSIFFHSNSNNKEVKNAVYQNPFLEPSLIDHFIGSFTDDEFLVILKNPVVTLNNLLNIVKNSFKPEVLQAVASHPLTHLASDAPEDQQHLLFTLDEAMLEHRNFSKNIALELIPRCNFKNIGFIRSLITKIFQLSDSRDCLILSNCLTLIINHRDFVHVASDLLNLFRTHKHLISPDIGFSLLEQVGAKLGNQLIELLPIDLMILKATPLQLETLLRVSQDYPFPESQLLLLMKACKNVKHHELFLLRKDLSQDSYQHLLNQNIDHKSLDFSLGKLSKSSRNDFFKQLNKRAEIQKICGSVFNFHLIKLKIKAIESTMEAWHNPKYNEVALASWDLYQTLNELAKERHLKTFGHHCQQAIDAKRPIFAQHRGLKQDFVDIINRLLAVITFKFCRGGDWRFFKTETDTMKKVNKIYDAVDTDFGLS